MNRKKELIWQVVMFLLLGIYLGIFAYLNLAKWTQHVDSDIASSAMLAREAWEQKTPTPDDWLSSTERYIFDPPTIAAVFYGMTGSMSKAMGITCVVLGAAFAVVFYCFLRKIGLSRLASAVSVLAICAFPINGQRNEGQMVPFVMLVLFLFADWYVLHSILMLLSILFYLRLKKQRTWGGKETATCLFLFVFATALALCGQHCLQMAILPMVAMEVLSLFVESEQLVKKLPKERYYATAFVGTLILAVFAASFYKGQTSYDMFLLKPQEVMERIFLVIPASILEGFGINGEAKLGGFVSLMQVLVWAFLALAGYGLFLMISKRREFSEDQKFAVSAFAMSVGLTALAIAITTAEPAHNYFTFSWFVAVIVLGILVDWFSTRKSAFVHIILAAVCIFAVCNLKYTYYDAVTTTDNLKDWEEVADYMIEEGLPYGYAEFWDANRIMLVRDGAVTMGCSYTMDHLGAYWWLTSKKWYPPALPREMRTAYVVRVPQKESFKAQFGEDDVMELGFENERFAVYISNINYMHMQ